MDTRRGNGNQPDLFGLSPKRSNQKIQTLTALRREGVEPSSGIGASIQWWRERPHSGGSCLQRSTVTDVLCPPPPPTPAGLLGRVQTSVNRNRLPFLRLSAWIAAAEVAELLGNCGSFAHPEWASISIMEVLRSRADGRILMAYPSSADAPFGMCIC